jgi:subtilisin family serine protease
MRRLPTGAVMLGIIAAFLTPAAAASGGQSQAPSFVPAATRAYVDGMVLVGYRQGTADTAQLRSEAAVGGQRVRTIGRGTRVLRVAKGQVMSAVAQLRKQPDVRYAEPNYILHADATPADPSFGQLWALNNTGQTLGCATSCYANATGTADADIDAPEAWDMTKGGTNATVGVVDTGIDYTHPDLAPNVWSAPAPFTVTIAGKTITCPAGSHGFNAITNTCDPMDDNDHGSHVSGTIGAAGNNQTGVVGVNWSASIMGLKFLDASGSGTTANAINAIEFAIQASKLTGANVRVLSNSWGGGGFSQALLDEITKANSENMLFVAAAGNSGVNTDTSPNYPSSYDAPNVVSVAATDNRDQKASFSNWGATSVDLGAPGVDILSTTVGNTYSWFSGTSMATPQVSGTAALMLAACPALTTASLKSTLLGSVDPVASMAGITTTGGRLNVNTAVRACATPPTTPPAAPTSLTATAGNGSVSLTWPASSGATSYTVKRSTTPGSGYAPVATGLTATSYNDTGLTNGTTYSYVVSASNSIGEGPDSVEASATPQAPPASFTMSVSPATRSVVRGSSTTYTVSLARSGGFTAGVSLSVAGLPSGATASFSANPATGSSSTLTVRTRTTTPRGTYTLRISGASSGVTTRQATVTLTVRRA